MKYRKMVEPKPINSGVSEKVKYCCDGKDSDKLNHNHEHHNYVHCNNKEEHACKCGHHHHLEVK